MFPSRMGAPAWHPHLRLFLPPQLPQRAKAVAVEVEGVLQAEVAHQVEVAHQALDAVLLGAPRLGAQELLPSVDNLHVSLRVAT